ncbi:MAG: uvr/rep helicase [Hyperionvirus sp.]|uniref:Uvr/rep helicase n=1 Tax=Hyperionvirus sp. TaxID=2487770 RepID=A0A3G5AA62_9VIRU|nr:MAG: uvr/rep helicase [Hyperionvirus sp.]
MKPFKKYRPIFLERLELDGYNDELKIAFEYNGLQHYKVCTRFHPNGEADLIKQQDRDKKKRELCTLNNISLIEIPPNYNCRNPKKLKTYIIQQVNELKNHLIESIQKESVEIDMNIYLKHLALTNVNLPFLRND